MEGFMSEHVCKLGGRAGRAATPCVRGKGAWRWVVKAERMPAALSLFN